jgi:predicted 2-oxoglutarate/Fe(II)-dependent dioxygenase YbiX
MTQFLSPGQPAPWFHAAALNGNPRYTFDTAAGRWQILLLLGSGRDEAGQAALRLLAENRELLDDRSACLFGVTVDPEDVSAGRVAQELPGIRWFLDYDRAVSTLFKAVRPGETDYQRHWLLLDPMQRVHRAATLSDGAEIFAELRRVLAARIEPPTAPVLVVTNILPPELCRQLIALYDEHGGFDSGFMREENGVTVRKVDHSHKRRSDYVIKDEALINRLKRQAYRNLFPMIERAFQFKVNRMERFIVGCYEAEQAGHFRPHRDNTTKGTAHRRFACTINLNAEDYDGGELRFPEFGRRTYRAPTGGAVIFSCSMLHEATPVTRGRRYAFLPFLYDDAAALIREQNLAHVAPEFQHYRSGLSSEGAEAASASAPG